MATITYNGLSLGVSNLITFTDIPNILKIADDGGGRKTVITLTFNGNLATVSHTEPWYITILDETITSVDDYANAINKSFYVSSNSTNTAASVAKALRNCPAIAASFTVEHNGQQVILTAKSVGNYNATIDTNIGAQYLTKSLTQGTANSPLYGAQVDVDVFKNGSYVTTLEKNYYGSECAFDLSPLLTTFANEAITVPYTAKISYIKNGQYVVLGNMPTNHIAQGYMVNQGNKFLILGSSNIVAMNCSRGTNRDVANNTILYLYGNTVPISFYGNSTGYVDIDVEYLNSAYSVFGGADAPYTITDASNKLHDFTIQLNDTYLKDAFYVDIIFRATNTTIRFNVIKPLKATEYYQRILWRNSYGGISFFDFTGQRSEARDVNVSTYYKNIFDYYTDPKNELEKIYDNDIKYTVTLKSHLFENDGKYVFNDLIQSPEVWTEINGESYGIIIDSCNVDETDRNNIYEATLKYHYSQEPSLI